MREDNSRFDLSSPSKWAVHCRVYITFGIIDYPSTMEKQQQQHSKPLDESGGACLPPDHECCEKHTILPRFKLQSRSYSAWLSNKFKNVRKKKPNGAASSGSRHGMERTAESRRITGRRQTPRAIRASQHVRVVYPAKKMGFPNDLMNRYLIHVSFKPPCLFYGDDGPFCSPLRYWVASNSGSVTVPLVVSWPGKLITHRGKSSNAGRHVGRQSDRFFVSHCTSLPTQGQVDYNFRWLPISTPT
jgi:hypothetical protein